jgi:hypothetical protein
VIRRLGATALLFVVAASVWWGVHPPRSTEAYRDRSLSTVETLQSQVATTRLWLRQVADDRVLRTTAAVALEETETDASSQSSTYSAWQPPDSASSRVRSEVTPLADEVVSALGDVRIAAHAGRWSEAVSEAGKLTGLLHRLDRLASELRRGGSR